MPFMASSDQIIRGKQWPDMARWGNDNDTWNVDMAAQTTYKDIQRVSEGARCMRKKTSKPSKRHGMEGRSKCALKEQGWTSNERQTSQILVQAVKGNACNTGNTTKKSKNIAPQCRPTSFMCGSSLAMVSRLSRSSHVVRLILQWFYHALSIYCKIHLKSIYQVFIQTCYHMSPYYHSVLLSPSSLRCCVTAQLTVPRFQVRSWFELLHESWGWQVQWGANLRISQNALGPVTFSIPEGCLHFGLSMPV